MTGMIVAPVGAAARGIHDGGATDENAAEAELAVTGRYFETGEELTGRRRPTGGAGE